MGVHFPKRIPQLITMSFTDKIRSSGSYSCEFWQAGDWNSTGCFYGRGTKSDRHFCQCNHTTSFALLFTPDKSIPQAYIPSITIALLSIVCFFVSIILSFCRQSKSIRHLSIGNIFNLISSIALFSLLTVLLIRGYQSSRAQSNTDIEVCSKAEQNLSISIYFFLILSFVSKTFLGICYFFTIFFHFIFIQYTALSNKWLYASLLLAILIALIPTIIIRVILNQWPKLFVRYDGICWLNTSVIFRSVSIPILIFISLNLLIIFAISTRLFQFVLGRKKAPTSEKRMNISLLIWVSLCISLGIAWIVGPFLEIISSESNRSARTVIQWIFSIFIGLEGVWVLIINIIFHFNQTRNVKKRPKNMNKSHKSDF